MIAAIASFIDRVEEQLAREDDADKDAGDFDWGEAFVTLCSGTIGVEFVDCLSELRRDAVNFFSLRSGPVDVAINGARGEFRSPAPIGDPNVDCVRFAWFPARSKNSAVIIIPHWNGEPRAYNVFARVIAALGNSTAILTLPYHGSRRYPGTRLANDFLSANIGKTIASMRQSVLDCAALCRWLAQQGYKSVVVVGISLGSCIASIAASYASEIKGAALLLTAGDFSSVVLSGRATRHIRDAMDGQVDLALVRQAWAIISPDSYADRLARRKIPIMMLAGSRDKVVLPELTLQFESELKKVNALVQTSWMSCGHYTLTMAPFNIMALFKVLRFVRAQCQP